MKLLTILFSCVFAFYACGSGTAPTSEDKGSGERQNAESSGAQASTPQPTPVQTAGGPQTIRDYFMLLPGDYFPLEGCEPAKDKDCEKAKRDYLKTYTEVEDIKNGYFKGGCDGAQSCIEMAIFKRPDGTYMIAGATTAEIFTDYFFLDYKDGKWTDIASQIVPDFSKNNMYEIPRSGTTVKVYAKKVIDKAFDYEVTERGAKLYDLTWKDGKFSRVK